MMEFTKEERNKIYKLALDYYNRDVEYSIRNEFLVDGLCKHIYDAAYILYQEKLNILSFKRSEAMNLFFPELVVQKPKGENFYSFWWDRSPYNTNRQRALLRMIKMTE